MKWVEIFSVFGIFQKITENWNTCVRPIPDTPEVNESYVRQRLRVYITHKIIVYSPVSVNLDPKTVYYVTMAFTNNIFLTKLETVKAILHVE